MLKNLKQTIKQLAQSAVAIAEQSLGSSTGQLKKKLAIDYVTSKLPVPTFFKGLIAAILSGFIDDSIEYAVKYMNSLESKTNGETYE